METLRRNAELSLLIIGAVIVTGAYILVGFGRFASLPANVWPFLGVVFGLLFAAHVATRRLAPAADGLLLPVAGLLNGLGYVFIARLDDDLAGLQATWTLVGIGAFVATLMFVPRARTLQRYRYTFMAIGVGLLVLPLLPVIGREINGARIWVSIGPMNFQPGEFAKIALAIFFAGYLVERREMLRSRLELRDLGPIALAWGLSLIVMMAQKDLGSSLLFFTLFVVMIWVATERVAYLVAGAGLFAVGAVLAGFAFSHVQTRVDIWLDPWADPLGSGFQIVEAQFALADGGVTGVGPALGVPQRIPEVETDFIFAAIGEELGLLGTTAVLMAYLFLIGSGLRIATRTTDGFDKLLAVGLTTLLGVQAFVIIAGIVRVLPLTGVTLPFVSYGGSSLLANYVLIALLMRISHETATR